jgi:hypothetical protein
MIETKVANQTFLGGDRRQSHRGVGSRHSGRGSPGVGDPDFVVAVVDRQVSISNLFTVPENEATPDEIAELLAQLDLIETTVVAWALALRAAIAEAQSRNASAAVSEPVV